MNKIYYQSCEYCTIENTCKLGNTDCDKCDDYLPYKTDHWEEYENEFETNFERETERW